MRFLIASLVLLSVVVSSCRAYESPGQVGNRERIDKFHQRKQVR